MSSKLNSFDMTKSGIITESNAVPNCNESFRIFPSCPEEEIVISGIAGRYPSCDNVEEFRYHLFNKIDMTSEREARWSKNFSAELPKRKGVLNSISKFDAAFFGIHSKLANSMDPQGRLVIETAYEAIIDAGIHPQSLRKTKTGVFVGVCFSEAEQSFSDDLNSSSGFTISGCSRAMVANRISYCLDLNGPSCAVDTACSSSMYALDVAFTAMRTGQCENALVCGTNLMLHPYTTINFMRLGIISKDDTCRPFDEDGHGYVRSECICAIFLQKARNAKRIYAKVVYSNTNVDGYKNDGILYPSRIMQCKLIEEFYKDLKLDPSMVSYVEAHGTGTKVGDPEEAGTLDTIFCKNRKGPLLIGSVKSNMGHSEASSGLCAITKAIIAFETGIIPPNLHFNKPKKEISSIIEGRLKVVTDLTPLPGNLIAINSFGFGGANAHVLFARYEKEKINFGIPKDSVPRLVLWAGRTRECVDRVFNVLEKKPLDAELIGLLHNISKYEQAGLLYLGYSILEKNETNNNKTTKCRSRMIEHFDVVKKRPVVWMFTGMGSQWAGMATSMMQIDLYRETIYECHEILKPFGLDLISIVTTTDETIFDNVINSFVGIAAIQIAIVKILKTLEIPMDYCIGHSLGELGCAYADDSLTMEQMLMGAYYRGVVSVELGACGSMAAIGLCYDDVKGLLPSSIDVACRNSCNSSTISGPKEDVTKFVAELKAKGVFAKEVKCSNIPYHSKYIAEMGPNLLKKLQASIPNPKRRSKKWISTSVSQCDWEKYQFSSAEYHVNNLLNPVLFEDASKHLPENAITIEIAPHGLLQAIIKKCMPNGVHIPLTNRGNDENAIFFLSSLGKLFLNGISMPIERLYPAVEFPVSRGTQMISPMLLWDHSQDWPVGEFDEKLTNISGERKILLDISNDESAYMAGHIIDGRCLLPATAYLHMVRESILSMIPSANFNTWDIEFENVKFLRATSLVKNVIVKLRIVVHIGSGNFEVSEGTTAIMNGTVRAYAKGPAVTDLSQWIQPNPNAITLDTKDFYKELRLRGYHYSGIFKSVIDVTEDGSLGRIKWTNNWPSFMDNMLQVYILAIDSRLLYLPTSIRRIRINTEKHLKTIAQLDSENPILEVRMSKDLGIVVCGGIEIEGLDCSSVSRRKAPGTEVLESYDFIPFINNLIEYSPLEAASITMQICLENHMQYRFKIVEVDESEIESEPQPEPAQILAPNKAEQESVPEETAKPDKDSSSINTLIQAFDEAIIKMPLIMADLTLLRKKKVEIDHVKVENVELKDHTNCQLIIGSNWLKNKNAIERAQTSLDDKGFLVLRECSSLCWNEIEQPAGFNLIALIRVPNETIILLQRMQPETNKTIVNIDSNDITFKWLEPLKEAVKNGPTIAVEQNNSNSGLLGLVNCIRREPGGNQIRCVLIDDKNAPAFDLNNPFYAKQMKLDLAMNVYRNGQWGAYRHTLLKRDIEEKGRIGHYYANTLRYGDLSSFEWMNGWIKSDKTPNLVYIHYSAINFRDVMMATGRLPIESFTQNRLYQQCLLGLEYSGINKNGERIMGMLATGSFATEGEQIGNLVWRIPDWMSLRDAATIPVVYGTIYYAFFFYKPISKGKSILIHAGSGGIGLAAIRIALAYGMEVYTTCSTEQKKKFIMDQYPQIKAENIGNSRDCSFEKMIMARTKGQGVDYVLNSLAEDKLLASVRCLGSGGVFLEIGKFDIMNNNKLDMRPFGKEIQFRSVFADRLYFSPIESAMVNKMLQKDVDSGLIQPLHTTVFQVNEIEKAFRYLSTGKHVGKVLIQVRENEKSIASYPMRVFQRAYFDPHMVHIIAGGLGGFGLELADWLILRGCRKLVLSSRNGIKTGYQAYRIKLWESYGCKVVISTADITTYKGCKQLFVESLTHGEIGGIFNLAVILRDSILENQTCESFIESFAPKAFATRYFDELSRTLCHKLQYFVIFSSASCGRGNAGQMNYGMANSIMERIIEQRVNDKLPGKAIQWGAVGDVGIVAQMTEEKIDLEIAGTVQQRISDCLNVLDDMLMSKNPIVSSMVVAQKHAVKHMDPIQSLMHIMGIRDIKSVSKNSSLAELGMDSLMAVEIKQVLEREYEFNLTAQDLRNLTFAKLQELTNSGKKVGQTSIIITDDLSVKNMQRNIMMRSIGKEQTANIVIMPLNDSNDNDACALFIPGIEGVISNSAAFNALCKMIKIPFFAVQLHAYRKEESFQNLISLISKDVLNLFKGKKWFCLVGHSFGGLIALELAKILERNGLTGEVILADGSTYLLRRLLKMLMSSTDSSQENIINFMQTQYAYQMLPDVKPDVIEKIIMEEKSFDIRIEKYVNLMKTNEYSMEYLKQLGYGLLNRIKMLLRENEEYVGDKIRSNIRLVRPKTQLIADIENDYKLQQCTNGHVTVDFIEGTHMTILDNGQLYQIINATCTKQR